MRRGQNVKNLIRHMNNKGVITPYNSQNIKYLLSNGYFRGYKAYRFISYYGVTLYLHIINIKEIKLIESLDIYMKSLFYPLLMQFETSLKNYTLSVIIPKDGKHPNIDSTFKNYILSYKTLYRVIGKQDISKSYKSTGYNKLIRLVSKVHHSSNIHHKLILYNKLINAVKYNMNQKILRHFKHENCFRFFDFNIDVPIWAVFTFITLGNLGYFLKNINYHKRIKIQKVIGIFDSSHDPTGNLLYKNVFDLVPLRNFVAHNGVIFDDRFNSDTQVSKGTITYLHHKTGIRNINFYFIEDYLILIVYYLCHFYPSSNIKYCKRVITNFKHYILEFRNDLSIIIGKYYGGVVFNLIFGDDVFIKLNIMYKVISSERFTNNRNMVI